MTLPKSIDELPQYWREVAELTPNTTQEGVIQRSCFKICAEQLEELLKCPSCGCSKDYAAESAGPEGWDGRICPDTFHLDWNTPLEGDETELLYSKK